MIKRILAILSIVSLTLAIGCSSKETAEDESGLGAEGADITESNSAFDPRGSDSGTITGLSTVHFEYDSSTLTEESKRLLAANAEWLNSNSNITLAIEGHSDARGSNEYNLTLGERRANTVRTYLQGMGVDGSRLITTTFGEEKLISMGDAENDHYQNRRANFVPR